MTKEDNIKEVMELVDAIGWQEFHCGSLIDSDQEKYIAAFTRSKDLRNAIESKVRELIAEVYREGYTDGYAEAQE